MTSNIPIPFVSGLTATPDIKSIVLEWLETDMHADGGGLSYKAIEKVIVYASQIDNFTTATEVTSGRKTATHATADERQRWYYWIRPKLMDASYGDVYPSSPDAGISAITSAASDAAYALQNGKLVHDRPGGNTSRISIKTLDGNDPTPTNPVLVNFPNSSGGYDLRKITAANNFTFSNGSIVGFIAGEPGRIWYSVYDDLGIIRIGGARCSSKYQIITGIAEFGLDATTVAEGGAGAADSIGIFYTGVAVTAKPFRIVGFADWDTGPANPGAADPDRVINFRAGMPLCGEEIAANRNTTFGTGSGSNLIPNDNTPPQDTEGNLFFSGALNSLAANLVRTRLDIIFSYTVNAFLIFAVFWGAGTDAKGVKIYRATANFLDSLQWTFMQQLGVTGAVTHQVRVGGDTAGTFNLNPQGGFTLGGLIASYYEVVLIMG